jgi:hypothetical protein
MTTPTFVKRLIDVEIGIGQGDKGLDGTKVTRLYGTNGPRVSAQITRNGMPGNSRASIRIYGLSLSDMNSVSSLGKPVIYDRNNTVTVFAGNAIDGMSIVFYGTIYEAWADFDGAPDVALNIDAVSGLIDAMKPIPPTSYSGSVDAATIMAGLAVQLGYAFENNGVSVILSNPYYPGTARDQVDACATEANIFAAIDGSGAGSTLAIWPKDGSRGGVIPLVSPDSGMIGYPGYMAGGLNIRMIYNNAIKFGGQIKVVSSLQTACGTWTVNRLNHNLESQTPHGAWFTEVGVYRLGDPDPNVLSK